MNKLIFVSTNVPLLPRIEHKERERERELFRIYEAFYMEFSLLACLPIILCSTLGMIGAFCFNY